MMFGEPASEIARLSDVDTQFRAIIRLSNQEVQSNLLALRHLEERSEQTTRYFDHLNYARGYLRDADPTWVADGQEYLDGFGCTHSGSRVVSTCTVEMLAA